MKVKLLLFSAIVTYLCTDIYAQNKPLGTNVENIIQDKTEAIEEYERANRNTRSTYFTTNIEADASQTTGDGTIITICIGQSVAFTATSTCQGDTTYILDADSLTYNWTISGRFDTIVMPNAGSQISHTFGTSGSYLVKCKAYNASSNTNTNINTLTVIVYRPQLEAYANLDTVCSGYEITLTGIAHQPQEQAQQYSLVSSNYSDSTQFLPDGCNLSFNMDVHTPDSFAIINSTSEIDHFYMNIEHSFFGDLNIMLECPNGQKCMLHSRSTNTSSLPAMDWTLTGGIHLEGSKDGMNHFLGMAITRTSTCLETPGTGWTYRIYPDGTIPFGSSSPTTTYYSYLSDPCNDEHATVQIVDTAPRNGKYGPYESMTSLIGCPINGTWSLHIKDDWSLDNGYLFDWGIVIENSINEWGIINNTSTSSQSSSSPTYTLSDFSWSGNGIDSVYTENGITTATAIPTVATGGNQEYTFSCTDNLGCSHDTTINVYVGRAIETPEIDQVVTDSINHNTITWTAIDNDEIQEYRIYRSVDSTNYDLVATIPASEPTVWTDETTDFSVRPYWYYITAEGECETPQSLQIESMYFTTIIETDVPQTTNEGINYANICNGQSITFTATNAFHGNSTYEQNDDILTYDWTIVTGTYDTIVMHDAGRQISRTFDTNGGFHIKCQSHDIYNAVNSNDNTIDVQVSIRPQIEATVNQDSICSGSEITLNGTIHPEQWQSQRPVGGSHYGIDLIPDNGEGYFSPPYSSSIEIHAHDSLATINSIDDIDHVYMNIEHSNFADLSIMLECPNGQKCLLHAHSNSAPTSMSWTLTGGIHLAESSSASGSEILGIAPNPIYSSDPCTLTPGEGWTYRIYPNGTKPFGYRSTAHNITFTDSCGNEYTKWVIDTIPYSSPNQYGPYESMTSLIGCPIDGSWKLYIKDRWRGHNGYLFEWGIHMHEAEDEWSYQNFYENSNLSWNGNGIATDTTDNGETTAIPVSSTTGLQEYTFSCTDNFGCTYDTSINVYVYRTTPVPEIKYVSTNVLNQNVIEFMPDDDEHITQYNIYRSADNDDYEFAVTLPPNTAIWTDMIANPSQQPYSYIVTSNDNCGESELTNHHQSMHLDMEQNQNAPTSLNWTHYEGFSYDNYKILRGNNPLSMEVIGVIPSEQNSFTDSVADGNYYYQIQIINASDSSIVSQSNIVYHNGLTAISEYGIPNFCVFPNPATTMLNISSSEEISLIEICSATGQTLLQMNVNGINATCDIKHLPSGLYFVIAHDDNGKTGITKFVKE